MSHHKKFSEKSLQALSSQNLTWEGVKSEEDAPEQRGFRDGVDLLFLGTIEQTNQRRREREKERDVEKHQHRSISEYRKLKVRVHK